MICCYENLNLRSGDRIVVPKSTYNLVMHHAVYLGQDLNGIHYVAENVYGHGTMLTEVSKFFRRYSKINRIERFNGNSFQKQQLIKRALSRLGLPYDLFKYNCEHFANEIINSRPHSKQVGNAIGIALLALCVGLVSQ